jgi:L-ascorbate metabolism protein UlaG (beta-lactamase superfamily)
VIRRLPLLAAVGVVPALVGAARGVRRSLGVRPADDFSSSPQWHDGAFHNRLPAQVVEEGSRASMAKDFATKGRSGRPRRPVHTVTPELPAQATELAATWLGHATVLLEVEGQWVLVDPVWSERVSPSATVGPRRNHPVPMPLADLPPIDVVLISHDHYDHLDTATIDALDAGGDGPVFVVPLGIGSHLRGWGVPEAKVVELDWEESHRVGGLTLTCTEARHFSGRGLTNNLTLWSSWVVAGERVKVFFGGDTGWTPAFSGIGEQHGPFDLTVLPIGAYDTRWSDVHMDPAEAVRAHRQVGGGVMLPIHWATFDLAFHEWAAPAEWVREEAAEHGVRLATPAPGERFEIGGELPAEPWWRASA